MWIEDGQNHDLYWIWWSLEIQEWDMAADPETASARRYGAVTKIFWYLDVKYFCVSSVWVVLIAAEVLLPIPGSAADQRWRWRAALEERGCNLDKLSWLVFSNVDIGTRIFHTIRIYEEFLLNRQLNSWNLNTCPQRFSIKESYRPRSRYIVHQSQNWRAW